MWPAVLGPHFRGKSGVHTDNAAAANNSNSHRTKFEFSGTFKAPQSFVQDIRFPRQSGSDLAWFNFQLRLLGSKGPVEGLQGK